MGKTRMFEKFNAYQQRLSESYGVKVEKNFDITGVFFDDILNYLKIRAIPRIWIEENGVNPYKISLMSGISTSITHNMMNDKWAPSRKTLLKIIRSMPIDWIRDFEADYQTVHPFYQMGLERKRCSVNSTNIVLEESILLPSTVSKSPFFEYDFDNRNLTILIEKSRQYKESRDAETEDRIHSNTFFAMLIYVYSVAREDGDCILFRTLSGVDDKKVPALFLCVANADGQRHRISVYGPIQMEAGRARAQRIARELVTAFEETDVLGIGPLTPA